MDPDTRQQVDERLEALYRRHLELGDVDGEVAGYYSSDRGYYELKRPADESDGFSVSMLSGAA